MATSAPPVDPWVIARNRYMTDLNEEERRLFQTASLGNLIESAGAAQKDHEEHSKSRAISRRLEPFVSAVSQFGQALDVYANTYSLAMGPIWGSVRVLLHVRGLDPSLRNDSLTSHDERLPSNSKSTSTISSTC